MSEKPIKVLLAKKKIDVHGRGSKLIARELRDAGMEVVYLGRFNQPPDVAKAAVEEGVHVIGLSCHSWEYLYYLDELFAELALHGARIPVVVGGSVVTPADARAIRAKGVAAAFGPGADPAEIVQTIERLAES